MADNFVVGDVAHLTLALTDLAGAAADPGALRLKVKPPSGTVATYTYGAGVEIVRTGAGAYYADVALGEPGTWWWRWESDAPNPGAGEGGLTCRASKVI